MLIASFLVANLLTCSAADAAGNPVYVHRQTGSKCCELVQHGSLFTTKEYRWGEIEGQGSETYAPEMVQRITIGISAHCGPRG